MSMSRKDFVNLANGLGGVAADHGYTRTGANPDFVDAIAAVKAACRAANSAFSGVTFDEHLWDVAEGRRDRDGRKVKART